MKIGILDSGIGGLSVLHRAAERLPDAEFIYYADTENVPYGEKPREEILKFVEHIMEFMVARSVDAVVVACNTATSVAIADIRQKYTFPIIGMEPAVKKAREEFPEGRTLVLATPVTVQGKKMKYLLERVDGDHMVDMIPTPKLVRMAEDEIFDGPMVEEYLNEQFKNFDSTDYSALVLGCTHFNYFKETLRRMVPDHIHLVDGIEGTVCQLVRKLGEIGLSAPEPTDPKAFAGNISYFFSGREANEADLAAVRKYLEVLDRVKSIN